MSDADDQLGGTGGETGPDPERATPGRDNAAPGGEDGDAEQDPAREDRESFPASDPPGNY